MNLPSLTWVLIVWNADCDDPASSWVEEVCADKSICYIFRERADLIPDVGIKIHLHNRRPSKHEGRDTIRPLVEGEILNVAAMVIYQHLSART